MQNYNVHDADERSATTATYKILCVAKLIFVNPSSMWGLSLVEVTDFMVSKRDCVRGGIAWAGVRCCLIFCDFNSLRLSAQPQGIHKVLYNWCQCAHKVLYNWCQTGSGTNSWSFSLTLSTMCQIDLRISHLLGHVAVRPVPSLGGESLFHGLNAICKHLINIYDALEVLSLKNVL